MLEEGETHPLALHYTHTSNLISGLCSQRHTLQKRDQSKEGVERKEMEQEECERIGKKPKGSWMWYIMPIISALRTLGSGQPRLE